MKEQGIGHSHAKIILMGEHSVVYGEPAIALPLPDVTLTVTIKLTNKGGHQSNSRKDGRSPTLNFFINAAF